ncbi:mitochondrial import receptor subunit TOM22 homolog isoform X1 [Cryptotermes secundus]|uniref:mitochondrial import receptor subunit TOM22 homolog isoform X1 n=2 Tax=Cryptotermes secundus TaxID=105785 RepID=UPI000CD7DDE0|nr:mitochondrial import receptor subunit TOM22 homolog isoform X1 [Cryptotermes secundus]
MAPGDDTDSGLESLSASNKSLATSSRKDSKDMKSEVEDDIEDEDLDETLSERLWGLTEMFPEGVRNITSAVVSSTCTGIKGFYGLSRIIAWCFFSSSAILFAPLIFEMERAQVEEMQRSQQKQVLLGPSSAMSGGMGLMPPIHR